MADCNTRNNRNRNGNGNGNENPPTVNLSKADLMAIATIVATTLQGMGVPNTNQRAPPPPPNGIKFHYESLRKNRCPVFVGDTSPEGGHNWLRISRRC